MWVSSLQDNDGVSSVIRDTQSNEEKSIRSSYVIGCDGARSALRDSTSITMDGPDELQSFVMIHATTDLSPVVGDSPATLYFITNPEIRSTFIAHDISKTWVLMKEWNSETEPMESFTTDKAREIFCKAAGISLDYPLEISNVGNWRMSCQIASKYSEGRIFVAGDAAHRGGPGEPHARAVAPARFDRRPPGGRAARRGTPARDRTFQPRNGACPTAVEVARRVTGTLPRTRG